MPTKQIIYSGRVQGVGFRYSTKQIASGYEVVGTVKNLPDGRVEMQVMSQDNDELEDFLAAIDESNLGSLIKEREINSIPPLVGQRSFSIVK
jgi:acylphosphatase